MIASTPKMPRPANVSPVEWRAREEMARRAQHRAARGAWWFLTLTFRRNVTQEEALRAFRWLIGQLARVHFGVHFPFMRVLDHQPGGRLHLHVLLGAWGDEHGPAHPSLGLDLWEHDAPLALGTGRAGSNHAEWYDAGRAGAGYVFLRHGGHEENIACPRTHACKRRSGCALAGAGWLD